MILCIDHYCFELLGHRVVDLLADLFVTISYKSCRNITFPSTVLAAIAYSLDPEAAKERTRAAATIR